MAPTMNKSSTPATTTHFKAWPNAAGFDVPIQVNTPIDVPISGKIPSWVAGSLYRTGPSQHKIAREKSKDGDFRMSHWFDGFTTVHRFDLLAGNDGNCSGARYSSRCTVDHMIEQARRTGSFEGISFAQKRDPCDSFYKKLKTVFKTAPYENIGVTVRDSQPGEIAKVKQNGAKVSGRNLLTVTTDASNICVIDADTLEPLGVTNQTALHPALTGPLAAAHAEVDPVNGDVYNYNLDFGPGGPTYRVFRANPTTGKTDVLATVSGLDIKGAYIHSLFLTENFVVLCVWAAHFKMAGISILLERNLLGAIGPFDPNAKAIWLVVDRRHNRGLVKKFTSPAFFSFHTTNAFETPSADGSGAVDITCELFQFNTLDILHTFYYEQLVSDGRRAAAQPDFDAGLARYRLASISLAPNSPDSPPSGSNKTGVAEKIMHLRSPLAGDLPRINPSYHTRPHRYVWAFVNRGRSTFSDGLVKTDTANGTCIYWERDKHTPGEPVFLRAPDARDEDDGVILCVVLDGTTSTSYLLCLNAKDMTEMGRVEVGLAVPFGLHGKHVAAKKY